MNKVAIGIALGAGIGSALYVPSLLMEDARHYDFALHNSDVKACADELGLVALRSTKLPDACSQFARDFEQQTVSREVAVSNKSGRSPTEEDESVTTYVLPSADTFRSSELLDPLEIEKTIDGGKRQALVVSVAMGVVTAAMTGYIKSVDEDFKENSSLNR